jgi:acyl-CoA thioester hydrolase
MSVYELKIYYEDTDAGGVVYYANYLRYFERARTEYFNDHGLSIAEMAKRGVYFIVVRAEVDFRVSAELGDILKVETKLTAFQKASLWVEYTIKRQDKVLVTGKTRIACINDDHRPIAIPQDVLEKLQNQG